MVSWSQGRWDGPRSLRCGLDSQGHLFLPPSFGAFVSLFENENKSGSCFLSDPGGRRLYGCLFFIIWKSVSPVFQWGEPSISDKWRPEFMSLYLVLRLGVGRGYADIKMQTFFFHVRACVWAKSLRSCPTFCNPTDCSPPGSPVYGILQATVLEWVAKPSSRDLPHPGIGTASLALISCIGRRILYHLGSPLSCTVMPEKIFISPWVFTVSYFNWITKALFSLQIVKSRTHISP